MSTDRTALTPAQRKAAERERHKKAGRVPVTVYVLPEQRATVRALEKRLMAMAILAPLTFHQASGPPKP